MRAARFHGREDIRVEDVTQQDIGDNQVRLDIDTTGICGSGLHEYSTGPNFIPADTPHPVTNQTAPVTMGHEFSGTITEVGTNVTTRSRGETVAVNPIIYCGECVQCRHSNYRLCESFGFHGISGNGGGFAESVVVDAEKAVPLGNDVSLEYGALVEPLSVGLHAVRQADIDPGDTVAVFGSGPIGMAVIQSVRLAGAGTIITSEPQETRRESAARSGADTVIDPTETDVVDRIHTITSGGVDVSFEVAGVEATFNDALISTKPTGQTVIVSIWEEAISTNLNPVVIGERSVIGTNAYVGGPRSHEEFGKVIDMIGAGKLDPDPLITDRIGLSEIVDQGFDRLIDTDTDQVKILVKPD
jgi:(R,R)-butanediol dehydrogenase/meso-butanediol dehydrogenase/diacetyl reductase